jgi:hypothetical protein
MYVYIGGNIFWYRTSLYLENILATDCCSLKTTAYYRTLSIYFVVSRMKADAVRKWSHVLQVPSGYDLGKYAIFSK